MDLEQALRTRRSVRDFTPEGVDRDTLRRLIDAAIQAPSAVNEQPWSFVVITDRALLAGISAESKTYMLASPHGTVVPRLRAMLADPAFDIFYGAPALVVIASVTQGAWAVEDCALAAENLLLAACAAGLGTCWIGFAQGWLASGEGKKALGLAENCLPVAPIIVGHPKSTPPPVPRKDPPVRWIG